MRNAIIVPTFPRDYHWTEQLLQSASEQETIILVFSSLHDRDLFKIPDNTKCKVELYVCSSEEEYRKQNPTIRTCTFKKLDALFHFAADFDYLAVIDTESIFLRPTTPYLQHIWQNGCLIANHSTHGDYYVNHCLTDLGITNYRYDPHLYFWFNEIPIYPTQYLVGFKDFLSKKTLNYDSFEFILFGIFLIQEHQFSLRIWKETSFFGAIEELHLYPENRHLVHHVNWSVWFEGVEALPNIKILFHLDRATRKT